tara:strand:+ start:583 stop:987 length:405 start_codon:yes stop_codon:yes gene_type:complete
MKVKQDFLIAVLREQYTERLNKVMESSMTDADGNVVIHKDLKVKHKDSGYEYTVDDVVGDKESGYRVVLREPEEPRFEPPPDGEEVLGGPQGEVMNEDDLLAPLAASETPESEEKEEVVFVIDQEEFEKEYEVD